MKMSHIKNDKLETEISKCIAFTVYSIIFMVVAFLFCIFLSHIEDKNVKIVNYKYCDSIRNICENAIDITYNEIYTYNEATDTTPLNYSANYQGLDTNKSYRVKLNIFVEKEKGYEYLGSVNKVFKPYDSNGNICIDFAVPTAKFKYKVTANIREKK